MTNLNNNELSARTNLHNFCNTVKAGLHNAVVSPSKRHALLVLLLLGAALCTAIYWPYHLPVSLVGIMFVPAEFTYLCWAAVSAAAVGYVPGALEMQHNFARIGFTNSAGEAPYLIQKEQRGNAVILTYHCTGFPVSAWVDKQLELESALNMLIASVKEGNDRRTVSLCCVPPEHVFDTIEWHERYILRNEDNKLILGRGLTGDVIVDIDKTPHILIGGNTGSGKSVLVQCLLWQAIQQADVVYVADFKGGVDFSYVWQEFAYIITEETKLLVLLNHLADTLEERKRLFKEVDAANITEYREKSGDYIEEIKGVYVPFWLFDANASGSGQYEATTSSSHRSGDYVITTTRHYDVRRAGTTQFMGVPVDGSTKMPNGHMDAIEPYDYRAFQPFSTAYLPGYMADKYDEDADTCQARAHSRMQNSVSSELSASITGYTA